ncbi:MAG: hypothetical protein IPJ79_16155 [Bacteroidetes bacterium]|nr:hypothetical protein [Bacteroidota bacterium]
MSNKKLVYVLLFVFINSLLFLSSCKTTRKTEKPVVIKESKSKEDKSADELMKLISDSSFNAEWINGKASVEAMVGDEKTPSTFLYV